MSREALARVPDACILPIRESHVGRLAQLVRALARQARGHWFESSIAHSRYVPVAQLDRASASGAEG